MTPRTCLVCIKLQWSTHALSLSYRWRICIGQKGVQRGGGWSRACVVTFPTTRCSWVLFCGGREKGWVGGGVKSPASSSSSLSQDWECLLHEGVPCAQGGVGAVVFRLGDGSDCVRQRRLLVMDCTVVNVEDHACGSSVSGLCAQESCSSMTGYD